MTEPAPSPSELILYQTEDNRTRIEVRLEQGTVWLTQAQLAELFQTTPQNITLHLRAIYAEGELREGATCKEYLQVRQEGARQIQRSLRHSADYQPDDPDTQVFFQTVQNKLHYAVSGKTAPELIAERADSTRPNMGLTSWRGALVRKGDVTIAKNYLKEQEITELNRVVTMFLDYAEDQARRRKQVFIRDWRAKLDDFLSFNERDVLPDAGRVTREEADRKAQQQYELFGQRRRVELEAKGQADLAGDLKALEDNTKELMKAKPKRKPPGKP